MVPIYWVGGAGADADAGAGADADAGAGAGAGAGADNAERVVASKQPSDTAFHRAHTKLHAAAANRAARKVASAGAPVTSAKRH